MLPFLLAISAALLIDGTPVPLMDRGAQTALSRAVLDNALYENFTRQTIISSQIIRADVNDHNVKLLNSNVYADNPDQPVDRSVETEFLPIDRITTHSFVKNDRGEEGYGLGTAFLVSPCYVTTNHHTIFGGQLEPEPGKGYSVKFAVGIGSREGFAGSTTGTPVAWGDRDAEGSNDWALLRLKSCLGSRPEIGFLALDGTESALALMGKSVAVASFRGDHVSGAMTLSFGKVRGYSEQNSTVYYDASTSKGSSGAPVFITIKGRLQVVGIHRAGEGSSSENFCFPSCSKANANEFVNMCDVLQNPHVHDLLTQDLAAWGQRNPASDRLTRPLPPRSRPP